MRKISKTVAVVFALFVLVISITGCADNGSEKQTAANNVTNNEAQAGEKSEESKSDEKADEFITVNLGDEINTDFFEMTIEKVLTSEELRPTETKGSYTYYENIEGETYLYITGKIKNIGGETYSAEMMDVRMIFDGKYKYYGRIAAEDGIDGFQGYHIKPLGSVRYYMYASVPDEIINTYSTCVVQFSFNDPFKDSRLFDRGEYEFCYEINLTK